jgi:hypothetical protein
MFVLSACCPPPLPNSERPLHDGNAIVSASSTSSIAASHLVITGVCSFAAGAMVTMLAMFVIRWCRQRFRSGGKGRDGSKPRSSAQNFYSGSPAPSTKSTPGFLVDCGTYSSIEMDGETVVLAMNKVTVSEATLKRNLMMKSTGSMTRTRLNLEDTDPSLL